MLITKVILSLTQAYGFNDKWASIIKRQSSSWATSQSHDLVSFADQLHEFNQGRKEKEHKKKKKSK